MWFFWFIDKIAIAVIAAVLLTVQVIKQIADNGSKTFDDCLEDIKDFFGDEDNLGWIIATIVAGIALVVTTLLIKPIPVIVTTALIYAAWIVYRKMVFKDLGPSFDSTTTLGKVVNTTNKWAWRMTVVFLILLPFLGVGTAFYKTCVKPAIVPQGYIGLERGYSGQILKSFGSGPHVILPWRSVEKVKNFYKKVQLSEPNGAFADWLKASGEVPQGEAEKYKQLVTNTLSCSAKGQQTAYVDVAFGYDYDPTKYVELRKRIAGDVEAIAIRPLTTNAVKKVVSSFSANQLITERDEFEKALVEALVTPLKKDGINIRYVAINGVFFTYGYEKGLENKALAEQTMKKNTLEAIKADQEAKINEVNALADSGAKSIKEVAKSGAERIEKEATADAEKATLMAEADGARMLSESITPELNRYHAAEAWDGTAPKQLFIPKGVAEMAIQAINTQNDQK